MSHRPGLLDAPPLHDGYASRGLVVVDPSPASAQAERPGGLDLNEDPARSARILSRQRGALDIKLAPPPHRASSGDVLCTLLERALDHFSMARRPTGAVPDAETEMMALLQGVVGLEREIRAHAARGRRA